MIAVLTLNPDRRLPKNSCLVVKSRSLQTKTKKIYLAAVDTKTNLHGVIDINDKIIIPFMYDEIYIWNIDSENETLMMVLQQ